GAHRRAVRSATVRARVRHAPLARLPGGAAGPHPGARSRPHLRGGGARAAGGGERGARRPPPGRHRGQLPDAGAGGGKSQAEIARIAGRSPAHVSYMRAVGEAILTLSEEERAALYSTPEATVPRFQRIAPLRTVEERAEALRSLLYEAGPATKRELKGAAQVRAGLSRKTGAWSVRMSYRDDDLRGDPALAARLERFLEDQLRRVRRLRPAPQQRKPVIWEIDSAE